jgi:succinate dehydrogenase hydrophobic anchor subunit
MENVERRSGGGLGSWVWLIQAFTGLLLIVLLGLHMVAHHFVVEGGLRTYQDVVAYIANPVVFVLEILFLISVTIHAALGLRAVILDFGLSPSGERNLNLVLSLAGAVAIVYGIWLSFLIAGQA